MKGDKRGRQGGGSQEQPRMEVMKGETRRQRQPRAAQNGDHEGSLGDKAAAASRPFGDFGDQQPSHWEVRTPIASSYLGKKIKFLRPPFLYRVPNELLVLSRTTVSTKVLHFGNMMPTAKAVADLCWRPATQDAFCFFGLNFSYFYWSKIWCSEGIS